MKSVHPEAKIVQVKVMQPERQQIVLRGVKLECRECGMKLIDFSQSGDRSCPQCKGNKDL